jgi:hypothetical protein
MHRESGVDACNIFNVWHSFHVPVAPEFELANGPPGVALQPVRVVLWHACCIGEVGMFTRRTPA